jgi:hypothetical protein
MIDPRKFREACEAFVRRRHSISTEEPKMTYEEAMIITRYGFRSGNAARMKLHTEATDLLRKRAEELNLEAEKKAEPARTLVDITLLPDYDYGPNYRQVKRTFSDGSHGMSHHTRGYAEELQAAFNAGKKAGVNAARMPRDEDFA